MMILQESLNQKIREAGYSMTHQQWIVLTILSHEDGLSQQELAARYRSSKVTILRFIDRLEKMEFVIRQKDPKDGRRNCIYLTDKGRDVQAELSPMAKENALRLSQGISNEDMAIFLKAMATIIDNAKE